MAITPEKSSIKSAENSGNFSRVSDVIQRSKENKPVKYSQNEISSEGSISMQYKEKAEAIESTDTSSQHNVEPIERESKKPNKTIVFLGATALALSIAIAAFFGLGGEKKPSEKPNSTITEPTPSNTLETPTTAPEPSITSAESLPSNEIIVPSIESLEVRADLSIEEAAKKIVDNINSFSTQGMSEEVFYSYYNDKRPTTIDSWCTEFINSYAKNYFVAMFGVNYESNPNVISFTDELIKVAKTRMNYYIRTMTSDRIIEGKKETGIPVYQYSLEYEKINSISKNNVEIMFHETDNLEKTRLAASAQGGPSIDGYGLFVYEFEETKSTNGNGNIITITKIVIQPTNN